MSKENVVTLIRALLTVVGSFFVGKVLAGHTIDTQLWQLIGGAVLTVISTVWGIFDKSIAVEAAESVVRQVALAVGGVLVALGKLSPDNLQTYIGVIAALLPVILSFLSKKKSVQLATGKIEAGQLKGVKQAA